MKKSVLNNLRKIREDNKYSYLDMSKMLNISKPFYWQIENGERRLTYDMARKIAAIFKKKPDDIFYKDF